MQGRRLPDVAWDDYFGWPTDLQPGDYFKLGKSLYGMKAPNGDEDCLQTTIHQVTEHQDGTITVSPSIVFQTGQHWHGFLEKGVWRSC